MNKKKVWRWNVNLAWELFSSGIYNYRLSLVEPKEHKRHAYLKTTIFNMTTSVEAYCNEIFGREKGWNEKQLKCNIASKIKALGIDYEKSNFKNSKFIRNELLVHYKGTDHHYFIEINQATALKAIEFSQDTIAEISFKRNIIFPYWITGLNFINPLFKNDICLMNDYEFWCRFKWLNLNKLIDLMVFSDGTIKPPKDEKIYKSLYKELWEELKKCNFKLKILDKLKFNRFPHMPFLTSEWWVD